MAHFLFGRIRLPDTCESAFTDNYFYDCFLLEEHQWRMRPHRNESVAVTYGCKSLQLYEYDENVYGYDANCE